MSELSVSSIVARAVTTGVLVATLVSCAPANPVEHPKPIVGKTPKVSAVLLELHEDYRSFLDREMEGQTYKPPQAGVVLIEDRVLIDATAATDANELERDLAKLGCIHSAAAAKIVSCQLPILMIPRLTHLDSLAFARPVQATTRR